MTDVTYTRKHTHSQSYVTIVMIGFDQDYPAHARRIYPPTLHVTWTTPSIS